MEGHSTVIYKIKGEKDEYEDTVCFVCATKAAIEEEGVIITPIVVKESFAFGNAMHCDRCAAMMGVIEL